MDSFAPARFHHIFLIVLLNLLAVANASDLAKEKRWADQVVDAILDGEAVWLNDGNSDYLSIYTESEEDSAKAVVIMHGTGIHPDWQQVVQPLRTGLIEYGWNTLSIQMPILENDAEYIDYAPLYDEVAPRVDTAIKYLKDNGIKKIVLIGHSQGAAMVTYYLASAKQGSDKTIVGFVAIGMASSEKDPRMNSIKLLESIQLPVLDLYGKDDLEDIKANAKSRSSAAEISGNKKYTQRVIPGNHFYDGNEEELTETVADWLSSR